MEDLRQLFLSEFKDISSRNSALEEVREMHCLVSPCFPKCPVHLLPQTKLYAAFNISHCFKILGESNRDYLSRAKWPLMEKKDLTYKLRHNSKSGEILYNEGVLSGKK